MVPFLLVCSLVIVSVALYCDAICRTSYELNKIYAEQEKAKKEDTTNRDVQRKFWR